MSKRKRKAMTLPNVGRPSVYKPDEHPPAIRILAGKWMPQREIAEEFGISPSTLTEWLRDHPELSAQYKLGREDCTDRVERSLEERANGYKHEAEKIVVARGVVKRVKVVEQYPPDPTSMKFWLTNRRGKEWAEKSTITIGDDRAARIAKARERTKKAKEE